VVQLVAGAEGGTTARRTGCTLGTGRWLPGGWREKAAGAGAGVQPAFLSCCRTVASATMAAKLTPMQLRAATQRRNSYITAGVAFGLVGGVYYYTMQAMSGAPLPAAATVRQLGAPQPAARSGVRKRP
jgi:hypothetical protein